MLDRSHHYSEIGLAIRSMLDSGEIYLHSGEYAEVAKFLDRKEYCLALETLAAILSEADGAYGHSTSAIIDDIASRMGLSDEAVVADLLAGSKHRSAAIG